MKGGLVRFLIRCATFCTRIAARLSGGPVLVTEWPPSKSRDPGIPHRGKVS